MANILIVDDDLDIIDSLRMILEANGHQNYRNWETMRTYHAAAGAAWTKADRGIFHLDADFYARSGGIFDASPHYEALFRSDRGSPA